MSTLKCRTSASPATQIIKFLISGGLSTLVHWTLMALLVWNGTQPVLATTIGAFLGSISNYFLQFHWTFNSVGTHSKATAAYASTVMLGWLINAGIFYLLTSAAHTPQSCAQLCATAVVAIVNFILYKRVVFHERIN